MDAITVLSVVTILVLIIILYLLNEIKKLKNELNRLDTDIEQLYNEQSETITIDLDWLQQLNDDEVNKDE